MPVRLLPGGKISKLVLLFTATVAFAFSAIFAQARFKEDCLGPQCYDQEVVKSNPSSYWPLDTNLEASRGSKELVIKDRKSLQKIPSPSPRGQYSWKMSSGSTSDTGQILIPPGSYQQVAVWFRANSDGTIFSQSDPKGQDYWSLDYERDRLVLRSQTDGEARVCQSLDWVPKGWQLLGITFQSQLKVSLDGRQFVSCSGNFLRSRPLRLGSFLEVTKELQIKEERPRQPDAAPEKAPGLENNLDTDASSLDTDASSLDTDASSLDTDASSVDTEELQNSDKDATATLESPSAQEEPASDNQETPDFSDQQEISWSASVVNVWPGSFTSLILWDTPSLNNLKTIASVVSEISKEQEPFLPRKTNTHGPAVDAEGCGIYVKDGQERYECYARVYQKKEPLAKIRYRINKGPWQKFKSITAEKRINLFPGALHSVRLGRFALPGLSWSKVSRSRAPARSLLSSQAMKIIKNSPGPALNLLRGLPRGQYICSLDIKNSSQSKGFYQLGSSRSVGSWNRLESRGSECILRSRKAPVSALVANILVEKYNSPRAVSPFFDGDSSGSRWKQTARGSVSVAPRSIISLKSKKLAIKDPAGFIEVLAQDKLGNKTIARRKIIPKASKEESISSSRPSARMSGGGNSVYQTGGQWWRVHNFVSGASLNVSRNIYTGQLLMVGGGGGGAGLGGDTGSGAGGGGGAGGLYFRSSNITVTAGSYYQNPGAGGAAGSGTSGGTGGRGGTTSSDLTGSALSAGGGGGGDSSANSGIGSTNSIGVSTTIAGGSGGGAGANRLTCSQYCSFSAASGSGGSYKGSGGRSYSTISLSANKGRGGGGGGSAGNGDDAQPWFGGDGGAGRSSLSGISFSTFTNGLVNVVAGGGGGGLADSYNNNTRGAGDGGSGCGGHGGYGYNGFAGVCLGSGGGGAGASRDQNASNSGGAGVIGLVSFRYRLDPNLESSPSIAETSPGSNLWTVQNYGTWDGEGITGYSLQWYIYDPGTFTSTPVGTGTTYQATESDIGKLIYLGVIANSSSYGSSSEAFTSTRTIADTFPPAAPTITSTPTNPSSSSSATFGWSGEAGATFRCSVNDETFANATACSSGDSFSGLSAGSNTFRVWQIDGSGNVSSAASYTWTILFVPENTAAPVVSGHLALGQTLTATTGEWTQSPTSYRYQWWRFGGLSPSPEAIPGATSSTYTITADDHNKQVFVEVWASNAGGESASASSLSTSSIDAQVPSVQSFTTSSSSPNSGSSISYTLVFSESITGLGAGDFSNGAFSSFGGVASGCKFLPQSPSGTSITVLIEDCGNGLLIPELNETSVVDSVGNTGPLSSAAGSEIWIGPPLVTGFAPSFSGSSTLGAIQTASEGTWGGSPSAYSYQWQRCTSNIDTGSCQNISGATASTYTITSSDDNKYLRIGISATNSIGTSAVVYSEIGSLVQYAPVNTVAPTVSGAASVGSLLTTNTGNWNAYPSITSYSYQWQSCNSDGTNCQNISGATASTYSVTSSEVGKKIRSRVTATNAQGPTAAFSLQTDAVSQAPSNTGPPSISGSPVVGSTLSGSDGTWVGFPSPSYTRAWQRCNEDGTGCQDIAGATGATYTLLAADAGKRIQLVVTASNLQGEAAAASAQVGPVGQTPVNDEPPVITGSSTVGAALSASTGSWSGYPAPSFSYQWKRCESVVSGNNYDAIESFADTGSSPRDMVIDAAGNIYTANRNSDTVTKITPAGVASSFATTGSQPYGIAIDSEGNVYTSNVGSDTVTKITPAGVASTFATTGSVPVSIAFDSAGNLYTANFGGNSVTKITPEGNDSTFASSFLPYDLVIDNLDNLYVAQSSVDNVQKITSAGTTSTLATVGDDPRGIALDAAGNIYTANFGSDNVSKITPSGTTSTLGATGTGPSRIAVDSFGNIYTANFGGNSITQILADGTSSVFASTDFAPFDLLFDPSGSLYVSNSGSNNVQKISVSSVSSVSVCTNIAGATSSGYTITPEDIGNTLLVSVVATNAHGSSSADSLETAEVIDGPPAVLSLTRTSPASSPTNAQTLTYQIQFSKSVTGFAIGDISKAPSSSSSWVFTPGNLQGSGDTYTFDLVRGGSSGTDGTVIPQIAANAVTGNSSGGPVENYDGPETTVDYTAPAAPVATSSIPAAISTTSATINFDGEVGASFRCGLLVPGGSTPTWESSSPCSSTTEHTFSSLTNGSYTAYVWQEDAVGNRSAPLENNFVVDVAEPEAGTPVCAPAEGSSEGDNGWFLGDVVCESDTVAAAAEISEAEFEVSTDSSCTSWTSYPADLEGSGNNKSARRQFNLSGNRCVRAKTTNLAGTASQPSPSLQMKIDRQDPVISSIGSIPSSPSSGQVLFGASTLEDSTSLPGSLHLQYRLAGSGGEWNTFPGAACATQNFSQAATSVSGSNCIVDTAATSNGQPLLGDGEYELRLLGRDRAGRTTTQTLDAKPERAGNTLVVRNSIALSLPSSTFSQTASPVAPASGTSASSATITTTSRSADILAGGEWTLRGCVPEEAPSQRLRSASGETFPTAAELEVISANGSPSPVQLAKTCDNTASLTNGPQNPEDDAVPVSYRLRQDLPWSVEADIYTLPLSFVASQTLNSISQTSSVPTNIELPTIIGEAKVGVELQATSGEWTLIPDEFNYQWQSCQFASGGSCQNIAGATLATYTPEASDTGKFLQVEVTASGAGGVSVAASSRTSAVQTNTEGVIGALGPIGWWRLNDVSDLVAAAQVGNDGSYQGSTSLGAGALSAGGNSAEFNNIERATDYVTIPAQTSDINAATDSFTISAFVEFASTSKADNFIWEEGGATNGVSLVLHNSTLYGLAWTDNTFISRISAEGITAGTPYHIAYGYDATIPATVLYINGNVAGNVLDNSGSSLGAHANSNAIAGVNGSTRNNWVILNVSQGNAAAKIGDVARFSRLLTQEEIQSIAEQRLP